jgi:beta-N-acetylhexosaminidase
MKALFLFSTLFIPILTFAQVTLNEKIAQMVMVAFTTSQASKDTLIVDLAERGLGGVLLFKYNLENPSQMKALTEELQLASRYPLFLATDQEGGRVARLDATNGFSSTLNHYTLGTTYNQEVRTRSEASKMAEWLTQVGINVNLAPVVDVRVNPDSPAIGRLNRSFSGDTNRVVEHATYFIDEFHQRSIATALKHYPGHGSALSDSHFGFTDISSTWKSYELAPFRALISNGYHDMIMTGHLFKSDWDTEFPTSLSETAIQTILRDSLNFDGVVISDELFMQAISDHFGFNEAIIQAIKAGTDILLFNKNIHNNRSIVAHIIEIVNGAIQNNELTEQRIEQSYERIQELKNRRISTTIRPLESLDLPEAIVISNYPNPFNPSTTLVITTPQSDYYSITVFNSLGQRIKELHSGNLQQGTVNFYFDATNLVSGLYFVRVQNSTQTKIHKITLLK